jgi:MFS family permease
MNDRATSIRLTNIIFVTQSLQSASLISIITLNTIAAVQLSGSESYAGIPSTILTLAQALASVPIGLMMGRFGRRVGLGFSYGTSSLGALLGVLAIWQGWFPLMLVSATLVGIGRSGADQSRFTAGELFLEHERAAMIGRIIFAGTIGAVVGPALVSPGGALAAQIGLHTNAGAWLVAMVFYGLASVVTFIFLRPEPMTIARTLQQMEPSSTDLDQEPERGTRELLRLPKVQLAILSMLIGQVVMTTLMTITPLHMSHSHYGTESISFVIMAHTLGMFGFSSVTGWLIDRYGRTIMMVAGAIILVISAVISPLSTDLIVLVVGLFLLGIGWNFAYVAGSSLLADALKGRERTRMQGTNDMLVSGAAALGTFSSGPIFSAGGYLAVTGTGLVITLLFLWLIFLLSPRMTKLRTA